MCGRTCSWFLGGFVVGILLVPCAIGEAIGGRFFGQEATWHDDLKWILLI